MSASTQCPHSDLHLNINNAGFGDTNLHYLEITARCKICGKRAAFRGPMGMMPDQPAVAPDGSEIRVPFIFEGEQLTGKPMGFSIRAALAETE